MKTFIVNELTKIPDSKDQVFDLANAPIKNCLGCWTCWLKTPGRCIHTDLDEFYRSYINADQVIFYAKLEHGFVSVKMKTLLDRMIPLFLPYTSFRDGGTYHFKRYKNYPDIIFCYDYNFEEEEEYQILYDYIMKVFNQFYAKKIIVCSVDEYEKEVCNENNSF